MVRVEAEMMPRSLRYAARRAQVQARRKSRAAPAGI